MSSLVLVLVQMKTDSKAPIETQDNGTSVKNNEEEEVTWTSATASKLGSSSSS